MPSFGATSGFRTYSQAATSRTAAEKAAQTRPQNQYGPPMASDMCWTSEAVRLPSLIWPST